MDNKDLITRFAEDCFRFEALHQEIDSLIAEVDSEVLTYEYVDLANQAAEIVLKLSANGNNVGERFYRYYVERLEYIIDYFRALLDYEETPLAEDEQNEQDDEPTAVGGFEGFPAGCVFPKFPDFFSKVGVLVAPTAKAEENAAADAADAAEGNEQTDEVDNEETPLAKDDENAAADAADAAEGNEQTDEVDNEETPLAKDDENAAADAADNENNTQAADSDEARPISEEELPLPPGVGPITEGACRRLEEFPPNVRAEVRDTFGMWDEMNDITGRNSGADVYAEAVEELDYAEWRFHNSQDCLKYGLLSSLVDNEQNLRERINMAIDAIPSFRDSEKFKELIEQYPTYKEKEQ